MPILTLKKGIVASVLTIALAVPVPRALRAAPAPLRGTVVDVETKRPIPFVTVILDRERSFISTKDGFFNFPTRRSVAMMQALETEAGTFYSSPYGGTKGFPTAGMTVR